MKKQFFLQVLRSNEIRGDDATENERNLQNAFVFALRGIISPTSIDK